ncbi:AraC family transcriptional regulator [Bifidobacterium saguini DSM 23967]|uniref:AraC family transcriptional regulator n=2 Tax=Bifidobacterium saguini TaxID=762210 RepID=A0A087DF22_9BIFI|nr:AraC family transcriptional regulator [Bifidobacterium saguini]KFI94122.1 AraC family transcriptional regulator [Bifidobacterium saguini DSM 23967]QTB90422.1 helix-turn-helix domain-containing protein [Bifidobacterium saguini]
MPAESISPSSPHVAPPAARRTADALNRAVPVNDDYSEDIHYDDPSTPIHFCMDYFDTLIGHEINIHWHTDFEFAFMLRGACDYHLHGTSNTIRLQQGDGVFVNSKMLHSADHPTPGAVMSCLTVSPLFFSGQPVGTIYLDHVLPVASKPFAGLKLTAERDAAILREIRALTAVGRHDPTRALDYMAHMAALWKELLRTLSARDIPEAPSVEQRREQRMRVMLVFIQQHYGEPIDLNDIAASASVSRTECYRLFKTHTGSSPVDYLLSYRLRQAAAKLASDDDNITRVARICGFANASYFGKRFREHFMLSPGAYRQQYDGRDPSASSAVRGI